VVTAEAGRIEWTSAMGRPEERGRAASRVEMKGEGGGGGGRGRWEGWEWGQAAQHAGPCSSVSGLPGCLCTSGYRNRERIGHREETEKAERENGEGKQQGQYSHFMRLKIEKKNKLLENSILTKWIR
jgi:hypothetical protein